MIDTLQPPIDIAAFAAMPVIVAEQLRANEALRMELIQRVLDSQPPLSAIYERRQLVKPADRSYGYQPVCGLAVFKEPTHPNRHFYQALSATGAVDPAAVKAALRTFKRQDVPPELVIRDLQRRDAISAAMGTVTKAEKLLIAAGYPVIIGELIRPLTTSFTPGDVLVSDLVYLRGTTLPQAMSQLKLGISSVANNL